MSRSAAVALTLVILSGFALAPRAAQAQSSDDHEVVEGNTLWELAGHFYDNPWLWVRIHEVNRDRIADPNLILPGQRLRIPDPETGRVREVTVVAPGEGGPTPPAESRQVQPRQQEVRRGPKPLARRTAFWPDTTPQVMIAEERPPLAEVSADVVYSSPWLIDGGAEVEHTGRVVGFAGAEREISTRRTANLDERVLVSIDGSRPAAGTLLRVFRVGGDVAGVGPIVRPTGVLRVVSVADAGVVARVEKLYARMALDDLVGPLPDYDPRPGVHAQPTSTEMEASVMGFATARAMYSIGDIVFIDRGAGDGVRIGDEFVAVVESGEGWEGVVEGRVQVVNARGDRASARITELHTPVFRRGLPLRLDRRIR